MVEDNYGQAWIKINSLFGKYERLGAEWSVYAWGIGITPEGVDCFLCDEETCGRDGEPVFRSYPGCLMRKIRVSIARMIMALA